MDRKSRQDLYREFTDFIGVEAQRERQLVNKKIVSVFFWCFLVPVGISAAVLILVNMRLLPHRFKAYLDVLILVSPVIYSIYFLASEVLRDLPALFRSGGIANTLRHCQKEGEWRLKVCDDMKRAIDASADEWGWLIESFRIDLQNLQARIRYLTALAGAVLFLVLEGLGSVAAPGDFGDISQFVGLILFLGLLYVSGSQTQQYLRRYLDCAELVLREKQR